MKIAKQIVDKLSLHKYPLIPFFLFFLISFYWLRGHPIGCGDTGLSAFFYNSKFISDIYRYTWNPLFSTGEISGQSVSILPISGFFGLLSSLSLLSLLGWFLSKEEFYLSLADFWTIKKP